MKKVFLLGLMLILSGCTSVSKDEQILKDTIVKYNTLLAEGYQKLNMTPLLHVATEEQSQIVYHHMSALGEADIKMIAKLEKIDFLDIKNTQDKAEVKTKEEWDYVHISINSGKTISENSVIYKLKYTLIKKADKWHVAEIKIESEEKI